MFRFRAYGITIDSPFDLPLLPATGNGDVLIRSQETTDTIRHAPGLFEPGRATLTFEGVRFDIEAPSDVVVTTMDGVPARWTHDLLLGPALGTMLHLRGELVLHGSCVRRGDRAIAFLGDSAWGKSSTAAAMRTLGWSPSTDDVLVVRPGGHTGQRAVAGVPWLKLWPSACRALGLVGGDGSPDEKVRVDFSEGWHDDAVPLEALVILGTGPAAMTRVPSGDAVAELIRHSYLATALVATGTQERHLVQTAALAAAVPCYLLTSLVGADHLTDVPRIVDATLGG